MDPIYNESRPLVFELKILKDFVLPYLACELDGWNISRMKAALYETWSRDYKTFFVLNSVEHEILNAHKY